MLQLCTLQNLSSFPDKKSIGFFLGLKCRNKKLAECQSFFCTERYMIERRPPRENVLNSSSREEKFI